MRREIQIEYVDVRDPDEDLEDGESKGSDGELTPEELEELDGIESESGGASHVHAREIDTDIELALALGFRTLQDYLATLDSPGLHITHILTGLDEEEDESEEEDPFYD